ncbi:MAG: phosphate ABC transporter permease PstA [Myxococcota bacterium]|nr:phosphate ABC transporter permease PstA [Myxococcota bacterium]
MNSPTDPRLRWATPEMQARLRRRHNAEARFRLLGIGALGLAALALVVLLVSLVSNGYSAFNQAQIRLDVHYDPGVLGLRSDVAAGPELDRALRRADYGAVVREALRQVFPDVQSRREVRALQGLVSTGARAHLREAALADPSLLGRTMSVWVPADDEVDQLLKGRIPRDAPESDRRLSDREIAWIDQLDSQGRIRRVFNAGFLRSGDSREPELAGIWGAVMGSFLTLLVTLGVSFPLGVAAAVYLEEFAPRTRWTDAIEVNINNLAAVPSIVFGLLGLAVFLNFLHLPRSAPLVGGLTLALMTLPTIIIAGRSAIKAVPPSIREAAQGLGASPLQVVTHHVLPLAMPGILTGTIIGMARALGETAPLLMIGMVAFVVDVPSGFGDASTALPVQIYLWADSPERGFVEKVSGAILVLLAFLILMNGVAIWMRQRFERKW